jgi:multidrug efflux pump subunit AcrA (membrane-fusion protein)
MALKNFKKSKKIVKIGVIILLLVILGGGGYFIYRQFYYQTPITAAAEGALQTTTARRGDLELSASGTGSYIPVSTANIGFETSGQIVELNVAIGDKVENGQVLARLDNTSAQVAYDQAQRTLLNLTSVASIATAEDAVATAETAVGSAKDTLVYIISYNVFNYEQKLAEAELALIAAQQTAKNNPSTDNTNAVTTAEAEVARYQKNLTSAWYYYDNTYVPEMFTVEQRTAGSKKVTKYIAKPSDADIASARAGYTLAKATLLEAQYYLAALTGEEIPADATGTALNEFKQAKLGVQTAQDTLDALELTSPISGIVTTVGAGLGDIVSSGTIITIADISNVNIEFYLDETDFDKVAVGYPVKVVFDSLPDLTFSGEVKSIDPSLSEQNGSKLVKGEAELDAISPEAQKKLLLGMNASIDVIGGTATNAIIISVDALHEIDTDQFGVYVLNNGKLTFKLVEVGLNDSYSAEIKSGLQQGAVVSTGLLETN